MPWNLVAGRDSTRNCGHTRKMGPPRRDSADRLFRRCPCANLVQIPVARGWVRDRRPPQSRDRGGKADARIVRSTEYPVEADGLLMTVSATLANVDLNLADAVAEAFRISNARRRPTKEPAGFSGPSARVARRRLCGGAFGRGALLLIGKWLYQVSRSTVPITRRRSRASFSRHSFLRMSARTRSRSSRKRRSHMPRSGCES